MTIYRTFTNRQTTLSSSSETGKQGGELHDCPRFLHLRRIHRRKGTSVLPGIEETALSTQAEEGSKSSLARAPQNKDAWNPYEEHKGPPKCSAGH